MFINQNIRNNMKSKEHIVKHHYKWSNEQLKELKEKYFYYIEHKEEAEKFFKRNWSSIVYEAVKLNITSKEINNKCSRFLGEHIAERVLSNVFKDVKRMPNGNRGFDFICNKGFKIDVKASCLNLHKNCYKFSIRCNKIADYFLLMGFDNRKDLNPQHIWLIKGSLVDEVKSLGITNNIEGLFNMSKYEMTDKLKDVINCCDVLKNKTL